jgi:hypothetical protein
MYKLIIILVSLLIITSLVMGGCGGGSKTTISIIPTTTKQTTTLPTSSPTPTTPIETPLSTPAEMPTPTTTKLQGEDYQIAVILDNVSRVNSLPTDIIKELTSSHSNVPTLSQGNNFACVYFSVVQINNVHTVGFGYENERPVLVTAENQKYESITGQVDMILVDPSNFATSPVEAPESATGFLVFQLHTQ